MKKRRNPWKPTPGLCRNLDPGLGNLRTLHVRNLDEVLVLEAVAQPSAWSREVFQKELALDWSRAWILESDPGKLGGLGVAAYIIFWLVHDELHVLNIVVHPEARRRGIARRLLEELARMAKANEYSVISLEVRASNTPARGLYHSLGFLEMGRRPNYYPDNREEAIILARVIEEQDGDD